MNKWIIMATLVILTVITSGCNSIELNSNWKNRAIAIDGNDADWKDVKHFIRKKNITVGVMNDDKYLYLCFYPTNRNLANQLLTQGFTLWFNGEGKKQKDFGIRFPLGLRSILKDTNKEYSGNRPGESRNRNGDMQPEMMEQMVKNMPHKLEILGSRPKDVKTVAFKNLVGMEIALGTQKGVFVYELKIPYEHNQVYSATIGAEPGSEIAICFETPEIEMEEMRSQIGDRSGGMDGMSGGNGGGGGRGGGGGGGGLGGGGGSGSRGGKSGGMSGGMSKGGMGRQMSSSLNAWAKIQLATETPTE